MTLVRELFWLGKALAKRQAIRSARRVADPVLRAHARELSEALTHERRRTEDAYALWAGQHELASALYRKLSDLRAEADDGDE